MNETTAAEPTQAKPEANVFSVLHAAHALEDRVEEACGRAGLSMAKFSVLSELVAAGEPVALGDLAGRLSCVRSNMTQLIDRLEADGLVRRVNSSTDRRSIKAEISALGRERQNVAADEVGKLNAEFAGVIQPEDREALERVVRALG